MQAVDFLITRQSVPARLLGEPGPEPDELARLLEIAVRVPDHGKLTPWRLIRIAGAARARLGERLAEIRAARDPSVEPAALEKDRQRFGHAPLVLAVVARLSSGHKVPEQEQLLSAGLVAYNLLLGARALGYGAQWLTGWPAYDPDAAALFGLAANERIIAFVHIGTPTGPVPERPRPDPASVLAELPL